jgi:hypothetical protein
MEDESADREASLREEDSTDGVSDELPIPILELPPKGVPRRSREEPHTSKAARSGR